MVCESVIAGSASRSLTLRVATGVAVKSGSSDAKSDVESAVTGSRNRRSCRFVVFLGRRPMMNRTRDESTVIGTVVVSPTFGVTRLTTVSVVKKGRLSITPGTSAAVIASAP